MMANVVRRGRYAAEMPITATTTKTRKVRNNCAVMCLSNRNGPKSVWPEAPATRMVDFIGPPGDGHLQQRLKAPKEVDHCGADLSSAFLLGPMSAARQHDRGPELGDQCRLLRDVLGENGGDKIVVARPVKCGNGHRRSGEGTPQ